MTTKDWYTRGYEAYSPGYDWADASSPYEPMTPEDRSAWLRGGQVAEGDDIRQQKLVSAYHSVETMADGNYSLAVVIEHMRTQIAGLTATIARQKAMLDEQQQEARALRTRLRDDMADLRREMRGELEEKEREISEVEDTISVRPGHDDLDAMEERIRANAKAIDGLADDMACLARETESHAVARGQDAAVLDALSGQEDLGAMAARITSVEGLADANQTSINTLANRIGNVEGKEKSVEWLRAHVEDMRSDLTGLRKSIAAIVDSWSSIMSSK